MKDQKVMDLRILWGQFRLMHQGRLCTCPTRNCKTSSKYKYNNVKHLKSCCEISQKKKSLAGNKVCNVCKKTFAKQSNCDRHIRQFHGKQFQISEVSNEIATDYYELNNDVPNMVAPPRFFLENVSDRVATDCDELNYDVPTMVTFPTRSGPENEIIDFNISGDVRSHQSVNTPQDMRQCNLPIVISR